MTENMKDSGIEWIGEIPDEWGFSRTKFIFNIVCGSTPDSDNFEYWDGEIAWITPADMDDSGYILSGERFITKKGYNSCGTTLVPIKSIVISNRAPIGKINLSQGILCTSQGCKCLVNTEVCMNYFYYYYYRNRNELEKLGKGTTFKELSTTDLANFPVIIPGLGEQHIIASFLDEKVGQVDDILVALNKQVGILNQYKKSLITETVTKGLNPDAEMKDSGIDWIGEIPKEWEIKPLKYFTKVISKGATPDDMSMVQDDMYIFRFIKAENIQNGYLRNEPEFFIDKLANNRLKRSILQENDLLFVIAGATIGKVAIMRKELCPCNTNQAVCFIRLNDDENPVFYKYVLQSNIISNVIQLYTVQSAQPNLSMNDIANIDLPYINDKMEQQQVADYLEKKCTQIDDLITDKQKQIEKMENYKKSLIYEYVTGKKRVRA